MYVRRREDREHSGSVRADNMAVCSPNTELELHSKHDINPDSGTAIIPSERDRKFSNKQ